MSTLKVGAIRGVSASSDAITVANDGTATANITNRTNRNLIINGAMQVAQRGTSSTDSGMKTVDRFQVLHNGTDEAPTQAQADVTSGGAYDSGFRKCLKITNGNQTSGVAAADYIMLNTRIESQDVANSGWNYTSTSSFITLSFWVKSSVAQEFHGFLLSADGTRKLYSFSTGSLTADTWTKVTKTIPGISDLQFDNNNEQGILLRIAMYRGTDGTGTITQNQWGTYNASIRYPNFTSAWYTTNDATFEITGMQLEVGSVATDFEHRSFGDELLKCQRYCQKNIATYAVAASSSNMNIRTSLFCEMRAAPTVSKIAADGSANSSTFIFGDMVSVSDNSTASPSITTYSGNQLSVPMQLGGFDNLTQYRVYRHEPQSTIQAIFLFSAEL